MRTHLDLTGRHALVCGASAGIGRATALILAGLGARTTLLARRADRLDALAADIKATGGIAEPIVADLDDREALSTLVTQLLDRSGPIHILVNNTGGPAGGALLQAPPEALLSTFERHVLGAHLLVQLTLPGMRSAGWGRIVNVLSTSVREPIANLGVSNTIRAAMAGWSKTLASELPPGITINNVLPGFTDTERLAVLAAARAEACGSTPEEVADDWSGQIPEGRLGRPEELAHVISFLCSPAASYVRGQSIAVDGGRLRGI